MEFLDGVGVHDLHDGVRGARRVFAVERAKTFHDIVELDGRVAEVWLITEGNPSFQLRLILVKSYPIVSKFYLTLTPHFSRIVWRLSIEKLHLGRH